MPELPPRCVICNDHATHRMTKTFYWHESWVYLTILAGLLIYAIVAMITRKSALVSYGLCDRHKTRRTVGFLVLAGGFVLGLGTMFMVGPQTGWLIPVGLAIMVGGSIAAIIMTQTLKPTRIDDQRAWFKAGAPFIESLSPHPAPPPYAGYGYGPPAPPGWAGYQGGWGPR